MTSRFATFVAIAASGAAFASAFTSPVYAQSTPAPDGQWRANPITLSTLLQDGFRIVAVVNDAHGNGPANTIFLQRDQSAFKCIDPQQPDAKTKTPAAAPACLELVQPSATPEPK